MLKTASTSLWSWGPDGPARRLQVSLIIKRLKSHGFGFIRHAAGSHEIWFNGETGRYMTVPNHPGDMPEGTLRAILRQVGMDAAAFLDG